jgi:hypothetical protein
VGSIPFRSTIQPAANFTPKTQMNKLPMNKQIQAVSALVEGCSIRSVERMTAIHRGIPSPFIGIPSCASWYAWARVASD